MAARKALDRRPGPLPEIQMDGDSVTYGFDLDGSRLQIRCDARGDVYAAISDASGGPFQPPPDHN
jgi:hypothetical protein